MNIVYGNFVVTKNGKKYPFEYDTFNEKDTYDVIVKLVEENGQFDEEFINLGLYEDGKYVGEDVDAYVIDDMESDGLISIEYDSITIGDFDDIYGFNGFNSFEDCVDYVEWCDDCEKDDSDKLNAIVEVAGTFDNISQDAFDNCTLISASDEEELGRALVDMGWYEVPEDERYFDYEELGNDMVQGGDFSETSYGYISNY